MKNSITLICCSVIISIGIGTFGYFIGKGIREFNSAKNNVRKEVEEGMKDDSEKE